jgi:hypothetical protein
MVDFEEEMNKYYSKLPAFILVLGAILRIAGTGAAAIWFDEANTLYRATMPFMLLWAEHSDNSGDLLYELIERPLMAISHNIWLLRLPSLLAGLLTLWLVWKLMKLLEFNLPQQCLTAALVAFLPGLIWISQDARSYGLLALMFLAALWFAIQCDWLGLVATCGLMIYCHNTGPVYAATVLMIALYLYPRKYKKIIWSGVAIAIAYVPAIINILQHWMVAQPWQPNLTLISLVNSIIGALWTGSSYSMAWFCIGFLVVAFISLFLLATKIKSQSHIMLIAAWVYPFILLDLFSLIFSNVVLYRTLQPMIIPFALWLGWELGLMRKPIVLRTILAGVWIWLLLVGLVFWDPSARGGHLDQVAADIRILWKAGDTLVYATRTVSMPFDYYLSDLPHSLPDIVKHPFMNFTDIELSSKPCDGPCLREWIVIPGDILITPSERIQLTNMVRGVPAIYEIKYLQAAPIFIYLVEVK